MLLRVGFVAAAVLGMLLLDPLSGVARKAGAPVEIGSRLELFVDDALIESMRGARLELHRPQPAGAIFKFDRPWEGNISWNLTTFHDGERYRLYYVGRSAPDYVRPSSLRPGEKVLPKHPDFLCYAESRDGIVWTKPPLGLVEFAGSKENNIVVTSSEGPGVPFLDGRPGVPAAERFKSGNPIRNASGGEMFIYASSDGLRWRKWREAPVFSSSLPNAFDSVNLIFWSETEKQYVCYFRFMTQGVRSIVRTTSRDLIQWTEQVPLDFGDTPVEHFYTNGISPYFRAPHLYVGFPKRFSPWRKYFDDMPSPGISDAAFMASRDGVHWNRFVEAFIRPGRDERNWVHRTTHVSSGVLATGPDEISVYASRNYTYPSTYMERFTLRTDGFVSLHATHPAADVVTRPLIFKGGTLQLNYETSAGGSIRLEIQDSAGRPISGFTLEESPVIFGDRIDAAVQWPRPQGTTDRDPLKRLAGTPVRLRFVMHDADLYSFQFK
jgi:hypothetical protein